MGLGLGGDGPDVPGLLLAVRELRVPRGRGRGADQHRRHPADHPVSAPGLGARSPAPWSGRGTEGTEARGPLDPWRARCTGRGAPPSEVVMRKPARSVLAAGFVLLASLPSLAYADGETLRVGQPGEVHLPADGKSVVPLPVELSGAKGAAADGTKITATSTGDVDVLTKETATVGGKALVVVRAREKTGTARVTVKTEQGQAAEVAILLGDPAGKLDLAGTFARLGMFFMTMMLMSLGAEKIADFFKIPLSMWRPEWRPKPRLSTYLGKDQTLVTLDKEKLKVIHLLMLGAHPARPEARAAREAGSIEDMCDDIEREDANRARVEGLWTTCMRLLAAMAGISLCLRLGVDAFEYVAPLGVTLPVGVGKWLTGFGASAGAAFWQDLFDKMTEYKKKIPSPGP